MADVKSAYFGFDTYPPTRTGGTRYEVVPQSCAFRGASPCWNGFLDNGLQLITDEAVMFHNGDVGDHFFKIGVGPAYGYAVPVSLGDDYFRAKDGIWVSTFGDVLIQEIMVTVFYS